MKDIGAQIRERRERLGWTVKKLAVLAGVDPGFLSRVERRKGGVQSDTLIKISGALGVSPNVFYASQGNVVDAPIGARRIPGLDYVQAGQWTGVVPADDDEMREFILTDLEHPPSAFAMRIRGDSMEPEFKSGEVVVINPMLPPKPGDFVVATDANGEATFKQYRDGGVNEKGSVLFELWPLNPLYAPWRSDRQQLAIVGTMVEHRRYRRR